MELHSTVYTKERPADCLYKAPELLWPQLSTWPAEAPDQKWEIKGLHVQKQQVKTQLVVFIALSLWGFQGPYSDVDAKPVVPLGITHFGETEVIIPRELRQEASVSSSTEGFFPEESDLPFIQNLLYWTNEDFFLHRKMLPKLPFQIKIDRCSH